MRKLVILIFLTAADAARDAVIAEPDPDVGEG